MCSNTGFVGNPWQITTNFLGAVSTLNLKGSFHANTADMEMFITERGMDFVFIPLFSLPLVSDIEVGEWIATEDNGQRSLMVRQF